MLLRVWQRYRRTFGRLALGIINDQKVVDDILQESITRILKSGRHFDSSEEAFNYLRCTVATTAIDWYRRLKRQRGYLSSRSIETPFRTVANRSLGPLEILLKDEEAESRRRLLRDVKCAVQRLPAEQREAIEVFFSRENGETIKTLCREKGVPYSTMRSRMMRGIDKLRKQLKKKSGNSNRQRVKEAS